MLSDSESGTAMASFRREESEDDVRRSPILLPPNARTDRPPSLPRNPAQDDGDESTYLLGRNRALHVDDGDDDDDADDPSAEVVASPRSPLARMPSLRLGADDFLNEVYDSPFLLPMATLVLRGPLVSSHP